MGLLPIDNNKPVIVFNGFGFKQSTFGNFALSSNEVHPIRSPARISSGMYFIFPYKKKKLTSRYF